MRWPLSFPSPKTNLEVGPDYADGERETVWVWIGEDGRVLDRPDLSVIPEGYVGTLGPLRPFPSATGPNESARSRSSQSTTTIRFIYQEYYTDDIHGLSDVEVTSSTSGGRTLSQTRTDANGYATVSCWNGSGPSVIVSASTASGGAVDVAYNPSGWWPFDDSRTAVKVVNPPCSNPPALLAHRPMANTLMAMREIEALYANSFGESRGTVDVYLEKGSNRGLYSVYNNVIIGDDAMGSNRGFHLWAHEYGHAFHHQALGGMPRGQCGSSHAFLDADDFGCAYAEGFAQFTSAFAISELYQPLYNRDESTSYAYRRVANNDQNYPGDPSVSERPSYVDDGSIIEGAFAGFLWDLYDGPSSPSEGGTEPFDQTSYPLSYVADVILTCQTDRYGDRDDEAGTDHLISCFEKRRVPYSTSLFRLRYEEGPSAYNYVPEESATEPPGWNADDIRTLWRHAFYRLGRQPLSVGISGPRTLSGGQSGTWYAQLSGGNGSTSYSWETRIIEGESPGGGGGDPAELYGEWTPAGTGASITKTMYSTLDRIDIRLTVTKGTSSRATYHSVYRID